MSEHYERSASVKLPGLTGLWHLETSSSIEFEEQGNKLELAFGRGDAVRSGQFVLRPYKRGGLVRYINTGTYYGTARFSQEFYVHRAIWKSGLPTVKPIGWGYQANKFGNKGVFLTKFASGTPWPHTWNQSTYFLHKLTTMLKSLCNWGLYVPDLNATNILVTPNEELVALDWDKAHWSKSNNLMELYQKRLIRSMKKLGAKKETLFKVQKCLEGN
jgi:hypothetical protein